jgi:hypothetical protein
VREAAAVKIDVGEVEGGEIDHLGSFGASVVVGHTFATGRSISSPLSQTENWFKFRHAKEQRCGRTVVRDIELRGKQLKKGQKILLAYPSANRDPEEFEDPDTFHIDRNPAHLAFGIGSHFCLGANLTRMEMRVALEHVLRRMPDMEYAAGGAVPVPSRLVRTCAEMKVRFTPEMGAQGCRSSLQRDGVQGVGFRFLTPAV